jgi:hypothetical protein
MTIVNDILLDDDFDLKIKNRDFPTGDSDEQHLQLITILDKGQIRFSPLTGLGIARKLQSPFGLQQKDSLRRDIYLQLELDGYNPSTAAVDIGDEILIKADR